MRKDKHGRIRSCENCKHWQSNKTCAVSGKPKCSDEICSKWKGQTWLPVLDWEGNPYQVKVPALQRHYIPEGWRGLRWLVMQVVTKPAMPWLPTPDLMAFAELQALSLPVIMPVGVEKRHNRHPKTRKRLTTMSYQEYALMPGYLLVGLAGNDCEQTAVYKVMRCAHVEGVLGRNNTPCKVSHNGFNKLADGLNEGWYDDSVKQIEKPRSPKVNDIVEILEGAYAGHTGPVEKLRYKSVEGKTLLSNVSVGLNLLGAVRPVGIQVDSVRLID